MTEKTSRLQSNRPVALVTGGAGFIGSHLCERLLASGLSVICVDNLLTGTAESLSNITGSPEFRFLQHNVHEPVRLDERVDYVLHLASPASPKDYHRYPLETLKSGSFSTHNLLELALDHHARFLLVSTSETYGDSQVNPQSEDYWGHVNPVGPRSVYDEAKRYAEAVTAAYYRHHGLDVRIARLFNTYGPRMHANDGRVLPAFITQALRGEPLTIFGNGAQTRAFCYVDDIVEGLYRLLMVNADVMEKPGSGFQRVVNLGNPDEITIHELAREVITLTESSSTLKFSDLPENDPHVRCPDITRAKKVIGWEPRVSRREGVQRLVSYFRSQLDREDKLTVTAQEFASNGSKASRGGHNGTNSNVPTAVQLETRPETAEERIEQLGPWFHNLHFPGGVQTAPSHFLGDFPAYKWAEISEFLPADLSGWTALDIGCNAGFYSFELARRGARVTAIDSSDFYLAQARWASEKMGMNDRITFEQKQVYDLAHSPERYDLVLFLGVFYHLRYPMLGLDIVASKAKRILVFQSLTLPGDEVIEDTGGVDLATRGDMNAQGWPKAVFIEHEFNGDPTNWWAPNHAGAQAMLRSAGMKIVASAGETYICQPNGLRSLPWGVREQFLSATHASP